MTQPTTGTLNIHTNSGGASNVNIGTAAFGRVNLFGNVAIGQAASNVSINGITDPIMMKVDISPSDSTALATSHQSIIYAPFNFYISSRSAPFFYVNTAPTTTNSVFDITDGGVSIYTVKPQIGATLNTSLATPGTLTSDPYLVNQGDRLIFRVDTTGGGTPTGARCIFRMT